jgi:hypothetical protein
MLPPLSLLALCLVSVTPSVLANTPGTFVNAGNTLISVMMVSNQVSVLLALTVHVDVRR